MVSDDELRELEREYGGRSVEREGPPDPLAAALLGMEDAISAAQEARWHSSRRHPTISVSSPNYTDRGPAFGRRRAMAERVGWDEQAWDCYYRAFVAHLAALDIALISNEADPPLLSVVDLRQWEPRPGIGVRHDEPVMLTDADSGWRRRGRFRRIWTSLFGS